MGSSRCRLSGLRIARRRGRICHLLEDDSRKMIPKFEFTREPHNLRLGSKIQPVLDALRNANAAAANKTAELIWRHVFSWEESPHAGDESTWSQFELIFATRKAFLAALKKVIVVFKFELNHTARPLWARQESSRLNHGAPSANFYWVISIWD